MAKNRFHYLTAPAATKHQPAVRRRCEDDRVSDNSHKQRPPVAQIERWLTEHHQAPISEVRPVRGGYWSSAWSYRAGDNDLILRLGDSGAGYRIDDAAASFGNAGLPVPKVLYIGDALGKAVAISQRLFGSFVEESEAKNASQVGAALTDLFVQMRSVPPRDVEWYKPTRGVSDWRSWLARDLPLPPIIDERWPSACDAHPDLRATRDRAVEAIVAWLPLCPERRDLIHRDLLHQNVLIDGDAITGIFSWKHSLFGDFLYDVAACSLWGAWHEAIAAADMWNRIQAVVPSTDLIDAAERLRMYQLHIAVEHLYWYVMTNNDKELARLLDVTTPLLS